MVAETNRLFNRYNLTKTGIRVVARLNSILLCHWIPCVTFIFMVTPTVFEIKIANKDLLSHLYLSDLIYQHGLSDFTLTGDTLRTHKMLGGAKPDISEPILSPAKSNLSKLVIFTEGLNLQQLTQVLQALVNVLSLVFYRVITVEGVSGFAVCAQVALKTQDNINKQLEDVAKRFSVELCLVEKTPSLKEPGLLLMDMDSTVIAVECIDELAELAGVGEQVSAVTILAMQGKLDFVQSLRTRVACLADADESILQQVRDALPLMPGVANLVKILKSYGWKVAIASGGFSYFADHLQDQLELDAAVANDLAIQNKKLTAKCKAILWMPMSKRKPLKT